MMNMLAVLLLFAITHPIRASQQNPLRDPTICGRPQCDIRNKKFSYTDKLYKYEYVADLTTEFIGTGGNSSVLFLKANLDLVFPKSCEGYLRINNVKLWNGKTVLTGDDNKSNDENKKFDFNDDDYYGEFTEVNNTEDDSLRLHPKSSILEMNMKQHILRFAFHDGLISEVCPNPNEAVWILNFKKGILSSVQNTMMRFDVDFNTTESDISGDCNVHYSLKSTDDVVIKIVKTKDIMNCRNRYSIHSILQTTPYKFRDDKTIWPILNSVSFCNMTIGKNIYKEVNCYERHQLIPFSNSNLGATTTSQSQLVLEGEEIYSSGEFLAENDELIKKRDTLHFDHTPTIKPTHGEIKAARDLLKEMCVFGFPYIQKNFISVFTNFLHAARSLNHKALTQLLARSESICENGMNHILESLPYIKTTASYKIMRDQIIGNTLPKSMVSNWMTSLSFIERPDEDTLETFYTIINFSQTKIDSQYTLCASAVVYSYCRHNTDCSKNPRIQHIVNFLEAEFFDIVQMYRGERQKLERMVVVLKGLGNIGIVNAHFAEKLLQIITKDIVPINLRLQAVMAFRRVNCPQYHPIFLTIYANNSINSEVRIAAYLQAMFCPTYRTIEEIKHVLNKEKVNQVGSFVWSHLKSLAKSSSPVRIEAQGLLLDDDLSDKFKMDIRKFSRNYEYSIFFDEYNFGGTTDINLIFGTESYLPRMTTLNFTVDLFGQSINLFQLSARAEGFEQFVASLFGPKGPLSREFFREKLSFFTQWLGNENSKYDDTFENLLSINSLRLKRATKDNFEKHTNEKESETIDHLNRTQRSTNVTSISSRIFNLQKDIDQLGYKLRYNYSYPRAQIGIRIFGNDLLYYSIEGISEVKSLIKDIDPFNRASKILSGKEVTYTKSRVLIDASYTIPLLIGLPLSINAFGASSVDFRISGNLLYNSSTRWYFDVEGKLKPSISVDILTTMQSDFFYTQSGIKVTGNIYSNFEVEANLKIHGREKVSLSLNLPQDQNEIFSASSELLVLNNNEELAQPGIKKRKENSTCTWPVLDKAIGLKICSVFSAPDLGHSSNVTYPGLILSGPLNFSILLAKSDRSAKKYIFEYIWDQKSNNSNWSLAFHTPGSMVTRLLIANISTIQEGINTSVLFQNGPSIVSAGCRYVNNTLCKGIEMFLITNGNRSLYLTMELKNEKNRFARLYKPKILLTINDINITGLVGTIRVSEKNGILQNDIDLSFETRKLQVLLRGNVVQNEITTSSNMTINYRFQTNKVESINFEGKLLNTDDKIKTEYHGNMKLKTSAYPKLNFASNFTWLSLQGHTEILLTHNNAPNLLDAKYANMLRLIFARSYSEDQIWEGSLTRASLDVKMPTSKIDFRILLKYEERYKNGTEHNLLLTLRYAPEKEVTGLFSLLLPRRNLFSIDACMKVTIPTFNSCGAHLKINERAAKDYMINFNGSWFTHHSIAIKGNYKDRSSHVQVLHHLKMVMESPSFELTALSIVYRCNQLLIFADVQAKYGSDLYSLTMQYSSQIGNNKNSNGELRLKIKESEYWINGKLLTSQPKMLQVEIHLDKLRDIQIKSSLLSIDVQKQLLLEFQWNINRDPSQRLGLLAEFSKTGIMKYNGNFMATYPDRTFNGGFIVHTDRPQYYGTLYASWNVNEMIQFKYIIGIVTDTNVHNWIHIEINTSFNGWQKNSLKAGIYNVGDTIVANTSALWANNQNLDISYKYNFMVENPLLRFDVRFEINSTLKDIPMINIKLAHFQNMKNVDTDLSLRYNYPNDIIKIYSLRCKWELSRSVQYQNISGMIMTISPFENYRKGVLAAKFSLTDKCEVQGAASLDLDFHEVTLSIDGYVKKFSDNMLIINITTPFEKFRTIYGRLGLNENKRHIVADVRAPYAALGVETLFDIKSLMNFDVKLSVATPIENFKEVSIFGKIKSDSVDMRGKWNNATIGFIGVWHMNELTDFEYSYRVFTPLKGFEENGFIAKLIKKDSFALEFHGKFSKYKLGIYLRGQPKTKLLKQLANNIIELEILYDDDFRPSHMKKDEDYSSENIDYDEFFSYNVEFGLDTLLLPTIYGTIDLQEIFDYYLITGNIELPDGRLEIQNRLHFPDYLNILNVLNLKTPFKIAPNIKSVIEYNIDLDFKNFFEKIYFSFAKDKFETLSTEVGFEAKYTCIENTLKPREHNIKLNIKLPFDIMREIEVEGKVELDDSIYRGNISTKTTHTYLSLATSVEIEENFLDASAAIILNTHVIPNYSCRGYFKKDFAKEENSVDIYFKLDENGKANEFQIYSTWSTDNFGQLFNANSKITTSMLPLKQAECFIQTSKGSNLLLNMDVIILSQNDLRMEYGTRAVKKDDIFNIEIWTPMKSFKNISVHGNLTPSSSDTRNINVGGQLFRNMVTYKLTGIIRMDDNYSLDTRLRIKPRIGPEGIIDLRATKLENVNFGYDFNLNAIEDGKMCEVSVRYTFSDTGGAEFLMSVKSTEPEISNINIRGKLQPCNKGQIIGEVSLDTPWIQFGIDKVNMHTVMSIDSDHGKVEASYHIGDYTGRGICSWAWIIEQDMQLMVESYVKHANAKPRLLHTSIKYLNPNRNYRNISLGSKLNLDSKWNLVIEGNVNYQSIDNIRFDIEAQLPEPFSDSHYFSGIYLGNLVSKQRRNSGLFLECKYYSELVKNNYLVSVMYKNDTNIQGDVHLEWGVANNISVIEGNIQLMRKTDTQRKIYAKLISPMYKNEPTFIIDGSYDLLKDDYHKVICSIESAASQRVADLDVTLKSLANLHGYVNSSTPFLNISWFKADFNFTTNKGDTYRYCRCRWPTDFAFYKLYSKYTGKDTQNDLHGKIEIEVPLTTRHRADIEYSLNETILIDRGQLKLIYNDKQILNSIYEHVGEHTPPIYRDRTKISVENDIKPLGIHYVNTRNWSNLENVLIVKHIEIFEFHNTLNLNLTGELYIRTTPKGQEMKIIAIHKNRTVTFTTNYENLNDKLANHKIKLELSPIAWIGYNILISNYSTVGNESQEFKVELSYPKRILSIEGYYSLTENKFLSDISFKWTGNFDVGNVKVIRTGFLWQSETLKNGDRDNQTVVFTLGHPYLEKDVTFKCTYYRGLIDLINVDLIIDYSNNLDHLITGGALLRNLSYQMGFKNYLLKIFAHHKISEVDIQFNGTALASTSTYKTESHALYKRQYFPDKRGKFFILVNSEKKEIEYMRLSPYKTLRLWILPSFRYPIYGINITIWNTPDTINSGYIYVDLLKRITRADINLTEDGSQNLQMIGYIPDLRSGYLDIWRNYEEIRVMDLSSYLKMNHSRLITGRFHWRPTIQDEIKEKINAVGTTIYNTLFDGVDFWIKSLYSETMEIIGIVVESAKEYNKDFIKDIGQLNVIEEDFEDLRIYMNKSYDSNDFYIKTAVNFTVIILDELALRDQIDSLPKIFSEIWQKLGKSGKAIRESIIWLFKAIKITYNNLQKAMSHFFHGESLQYLTNLIEKGVEKYDKVIKELHISFIKYVEKLWNKFWNVISIYWKGVLKRFEPHIFNFMSYIESTTWNLSKEVFDFIYKRTNELAESPYFSKVSSFTQDVDRLYKDIKSHDAITNIKKYSGIAWNFVKDKYFTLVPFGKELNEVFKEIWEEINELKKNEYVQIMLQKYHEILAKIEWIVNELQLEMRFHQLYSLLRNKFCNYALNALQTADMYREAKTKFVFDPEKGIMDLEQKLPVSWHAFNETPNFKEIPEYKFIAQTRDLFIKTNASILKYIYNIRSHLDSKTWFPPYYSRALLIDSRHYMTFDKCFVGLNLNLQKTTIIEDTIKCSYLLAHDFFQRNFTLMLEQSKRTSTSEVVYARKFSFIANDQVLEIDLENDSLTVNGNYQPVLPLQIGDINIHNDLNILSIRSDTEFSLQCNMQFDLCSFEVSGWYFGHTAGLLGTMNNEPFDELTTSQNSIMSQIHLKKFTDSWNTNHCKQTKSILSAVVEKPEVSKKVLEICNIFFKSGVLSSCVNTVNPQPFFNMCLDLGNNSNLIKPDQPALKGACTSALAYIEACSLAKIPLRVPHQCVFCALSNGSYVPEGTFIELSGEAVPRSSDIVVIVEAKLCNFNLIEIKNIMPLLAIIEEQLQVQKITNNRYAVMAFGAHSSPFNNPRSVTQDNRVFVEDFNKLQQYFIQIKQYISPTNEPSLNNDILQAISTASKLNFRPGVSKTFILLPCSNCAAKHMRFDYTSILQYMLEEGVNLHILADIDFDFERTRKLRHFFGVDKYLVYSKRFPEGDSEARSQLFIPRSNLGICTPLALGTEGSVFSARKLLLDQKYSVKRFATIFAKRVAKSATPNQNQTCECSGHNTGVSYMACSPTLYPDERNILDDYDFELEDWEIKNVEMK